MGYFITIKQPDDDLLKKFLDDPKTLFGKPYAGHIIFVVGSSDIETVDWLKQSLKELDSLTRDYVAYTLVGEEIRVSIAVDKYYSAERMPQYLGKYDFYRIDELAKKGKLGVLLSDGDYFDALTYGADKIARYFEVVDQQPCAIIFDGYLDKDFLVVPLDQVSQNRFTKVLRQAINELCKDKRYASYLRALQDLGSVQEKIKILINEIKLAQSHLDNIPTATEVSLIHYEWEDKIFQSLKKGTHRGFRKTLQSLENEYKLCLGIDLSEEQGSKIVSFAKTLDVLRSFERMNWPLDTLSKYKLEKAFSEHVVRLLKGDSQLEFIEGKPQLKNIISRLTRNQDELIIQIYEEIDFRSRIETYFANNKSKLSKKKQLAQAELEHFISKSEVILKDLDGRNSPSFTRIMKSILKKERITNDIRLATTMAKAYGGKLLDPKNLINILESAYKLIG